MEGDEARDLKTQARHERERGGISLFGRRCIINIKKMKGVCQRGSKGSVVIATECKKKSLRAYPLATLLHFCLFLCPLRGRNERETNAGIAKKH